MEKRNMKQHVSLVGALHVGFGILGLLGALAVYFGFHFAYSFVEHEPIAEKVLIFVGNTLSLIILLFSRSWNHRWSGIVFTQTMGQDPGHDRFGYQLPEYSNRDSQRCVFHLGTYAARIHRAVQPHLISFPFCVVGMK